MAQGSEPGGSGGDGPGMLGRLRQGGGGRSSFVYVVIGVVALTLVLLLAIIYFSASERERTSPPICTDIAMAEAEEAVLEGRVERLTVVYDDTPWTPTSERYGPVLAKLDHVDGSCSNLPQGVANQEVVYAIAGLIAFYNENTEGQTVEIVWQEEANLRESLFATPTAVPTETPTAAPTEPPTATATETDVGNVVIPGIGTPTVIGPPAASPAADPVSRVVATP